jgi:hypothetical protein
MSFVDASEVGVSVERRDSTANIYDGGVTPTILVRHEIIVVLERRLDLNTASLLKGILCSLKTSTLDVTTT